MQPLGSPAATKPDFKGGKSAAVWFGHFLGNQKSIKFGKKIHDFFWPNFDVRKEQVSNTKIEHGQTDAENPYKTATIARHRPELQHRKEQNECKICLKSDQ